MTNFIQINGKKIELTDEQVQQITNIKTGMIKAENPFEKVKEGDCFHYISASGKVYAKEENGDADCDKLYDAANYCDDDKLIKQRALHEILSRLLWRFSMTHGSDEIDWGDADNYKYYIFYNCKIKSFGVDGSYFLRQSTECYFLDRQTAEQAIKEIVIPFLEQHPEFVW